MAKVTRPELIAAGEGHDWPLAFLRRQFFAVLDQEAPEVREDLRDSVLPVFREAVDALVARARREAAATGDTTLPAWWPAVHEEPWDIASSDNASSWYTAAVDLALPEVGELRAALDGWATRWRLHADWITDTTIRTMLYWHRVPDQVGEEWQPLLPGWPGALHVGDPPFEFHANWEPTIEERSGAKRRITEQFHAELKTFLDGVEARASERGFVAAGRSEAKDEHMHWLVRYQALGQKFTEIAATITPADPEASRKTVSLGVQRASDLVGLPLRERDRGAIDS